MQLRVTKAGNSLALHLPKELVARMRIRQGDTFYAVEDGDRLIVCPYDPKFAEDMDLGEDAMWRDREMLRALGESSR